MSSVLADMDEQEFVNEVYRRLKDLRQKVFENVQTEMNFLMWDPVTADLQTQLTTLNSWLSESEPRTLGNLKNILTILSASDQRGNDGYFNKWRDSEIIGYRESSGLNAENVSTLLSIIDQNFPLPQASANAGEQKHAHSMFRTLVVKY